MEEEMKLEEIPKTNEEELQQIQTQFVSQPSSYAPLFIKLDKYEGIIRRVETLSELIKEMKEILKINDEIERTRKEILSLLAKNIQEISRIVSLLDRDFIRTTKFDQKSYDLESENRKVEDIEQQVSELKRHLDELKKYF